MICSSGLLLGILAFACCGGDVCPEACISFASISRTFASSASRLRAASVTACFLHEAVSSVVPGQANNGERTYFSSTVCSSWPTPASELSGTDPEPKPNMESRSVAKLCTMVL